MPKMKVWDGSAWNDVAPSKAEFDAHKADTTQRAINVMSAPYNATGDGSTDDTAAIQSALDAAGTAGGGIVFLPVGTYITSDTLKIPNYVILMGAGWKSIIKLSGATTTGEDAITNKDTSDPQGIVVRDLQLDANSVGSAPSNRQHGITMFRVSGFTIDNVKVVNCTGYGIWAAETYPGGTNYAQYGQIINSYVEDCQVHIETTNARYVVIENNTVIMKTQAASGIHPNDGSRDIKISNNTVIGDQTNGAGIDITNATEIDLVDNTVRMDRKDGTSDKAEAVIIQSAASNIRFKGGLYYAENDIAIAVYSGNHISVNEAELNGDTQGFFADGDDDISVQNSTVYARGGTAVNTYGIYIINSTDWIVSGNRVEITADAGYAFPLYLTAGGTEGNNLLSPEQDRLPYTSLTLEGSWANVATPTYYGAEHRINRKNNKVELRGFIGGGSVGSTITTIPEGARPGKNVYRMLYTEDGSSNRQVGFVIINSSGVMTFSSGYTTYVDLGSIEPWDAEQ